WNKEPGTKNRERRTKNRELVFIFLPSLAAAKTSPRCSRIHLQSPLPGAALQSTALLPPSSSSTNTKSPASSWERHALPRRNEQIAWCPFHPVRSARTLPRAEKFQPAWAGSHHQSDSTEP